MANNILVRSTPPSELLQDTAHGTVSNAFEITATGAQTKDFTTDLVTVFSVAGANNYDAVNDVLKLKENIRYEIEVFFRMIPTSASNFIEFTLGTDLDASLSTNTLETQKCSLKFESFIASAVMESAGIALTLKNFTGATGAKIYNLQISIKELG